MQDFSTLWDILSTTAISRCWPILIYTAIWSSAISLLNYYTHGKLSISPALITVFGTILGFVISFRTTSAIERYNDGRKYWAQIVLNCRIFARTVWFHVPAGNDPMSNEEARQARTLIEKKTVVNLLEAYAVAVKHYLRGEDGIYYEDLHPLVSFLPPYSSPPIISSPNPPELHRRPTYTSTSSHRSHDIPASPGSRTRATGSKASLSTTPAVHSRTADWSFASENEVGDDESILPATMPPKRSWRVAFPFSLFFWPWTTKKDARKAVWVHRRGRGIRANENNVPLEITLFLSSYISALQVRKVLDVPTTNLLYASLNQLVDALTGLERILTTPIPVSYCWHLWTVTTVYCTTLPFQLWSSLGWVSIPASVIASFIFFGFLVAGEEIENPFGYDRNDLDMDHFVEDIIRKELHTLTTIPTPDPSIWAFSPANKFLRTLSGGQETPDDWLQKGTAAILGALQGDGSTEVVVK